MAPKSKRTRSIALLRAVNVAGHNQVRMAGLCQMATELGLEDVRPVLQSGNLVFSGAGRKSEELERLLEDACQRRFGIATSFFVRTAAEWTDIGAGNPFVQQAASDPGHLVVMFLKRAPDRARVSALARAILGSELVSVRGRHAYIVYPDGIGRSRVSNAWLEKELGSPGTGRNWNTFQKLAALVDQG
jgi:uncharacterized protein (DUF1697 family)